ncbi:hypothetical protein MHYP_G00146780 [Metynnis hypsauchen]
MALNVGLVQTALTVALVKSKSTAQQGLCGLDQVYTAHSQPCSGPHSGRVMQVRCGPAHAGPEWVLSSRSEELHFSTSTTCGLPPWRLRNLTERGFCGLDEEHARRFQRSEAA